ncbi:hypothetical protein [Adoxophyes orana nucleopolyhedrovirus]|uniref:hypothetical protein n=1 Tax=Adoxophyes orana nucleopolyhedrovirus TaxID=542343 RepID=UPI0001829BD8|nr:hypothetical protein [Adoxophyes orana nucleopolyhedrovirus]ACF05299.1 hypothetical protein [Adoxophyes orana nucleopolyhedrovirus]
MDSEFRSALQRLHQHNEDIKRYQEIVSVLSRLIYSCPNSKSVLKLQRELKIVDEMHLEINETCQYGFDRQTLESNVLYPALQQLNDEMKDTDRTESWHKTYCRKKYADLYKILDSNYLLPETDDSFVQINATLKALRVNPNYYTYDMHTDLSKYNPKNALAAKNFKKYNESRKATNRNNLIKCFKRACRSKTTKSLNPRTQTMLIYMKMKNEFEKIKLKTNENDVWLKMLIKYVPDFDKNGAATYFLNKNL